MHPSASQPLACLTADGRSGKDGALLDVGVVLPRPWMKSYLREVRETGVLASGCRAADVSRQAALKWRDKSPAFRRACEDAVEEAMDRIEEKAFQLAIAGNARLIIFILKHRRREVYGDRVEVTQNANALQVCTTPEQVAAMMRQRYPELSGCPSGVSRRDLRLPR
jgi:hypothetical protein